MSETIGIVELYQHNEVLTHYCKLLLQSDSQIYVFCNEKVFHQLPKELQTSRIIWKLNKDESKISEFLNLHNDKIEGCDLCLVTTVFSDFKAFNHLNNLTKCIFVIHSAYTWFEPLKHIHLRAGHKVSDFLRLMKFIVTGQRKCRHRILNSCYKIALPNQRILDHMYQRVPNEYKSKLISLPFGAYDHPSHASKDKSKLNLIHLVIPGTLSPEVRDYYCIINAIKDLNNDQRLKIKLSLLGNANSLFGKKIIAAFEKLQNEMFVLQYWSEFIDQDLYDRVLSESDCLLLPLKEYTQFYVFRERTCLSKLSGSVNDMIKFGKPTIVSQHLKIDDQIDQKIIRYSNTDELTGVLRSLSKPPSLNIPQFKHYSYPALLKDFKHQIDL